MNQLIRTWLDCKEAERIAVEHRRSAEDMLSSMFRIPESLDGTVNNEVDGYQIKIVGRMNRKIDSEKLQEIAAEHGLSEHLASLFRWKPEIDSKAWKGADESITKPLLDEITTTPGRPSYSITIKEQ